MSTTTQTKRLQVNLMAPDGTVSPVYGPEYTPLSDVQYALWGACAGVSSTLVKFWHQLTGLAPAFHDDQPLVVDRAALLCLDALLETHSDYTNAAEEMPKVEPSLVDIQLAHLEHLSRRASAIRELLKSKTGLDMNPHLLF